MTAVSLYSNVQSTTSTVVDLFPWLQSDTHAETVMRYRQTKNPALKKSLPAITPAGITTRTAGNSQLLTPSGYGQLDFDHVDPERVKDLLCQIQEIAWIAGSTSGQGAFALIRISDPERYSSQVRQAANLIQQHFGLTADLAPTNPCSLRFATLDPQPYYNPNAAAFTGYEATKPVKRYVSITLPRKSGREDFLRVLERIQNSGVDLTEDYADWIKIGMALKAEFGDAGLDYFHIVSQNHPNYCPRETERKYKSFKPNKVSIATFYHYAKTTD